MVENGVKARMMGSYENPPDLSPQTWLKMEFREQDTNGKWLEEMSREKEVR